MNISLLRNFYYCFNMYIYIYSTLLIIKLYYCIYFFIYFAFLFLHNIT